MDGLDTLMWKREYIPIEIMECRRRDNTMFYDISPVSLPPFHPSMEKEGIDIICNIMNGYLTRIGRKWPGKNLSETFSRFT